MRHPRRRRNVGLVVAALGALALISAFILGRARGVGTLEILLGGLGMNAAIAGTAIAVVAHLRITRRYDRLERGEGVLARWRIDPERWQVFRQAAETRAVAPKAVPHELKLPDEIPAEGIELIIAQDAFRLGADFEPLEKNAFVRLAGPVLEIQQLVAANRSSRIVVYRLPVPENAEADVARIAQRYSLQAEASSQRVRAIAWVALVVALAALVAIVGWAMSVTSR